MPEMFVDKFRSLVPKYLGRKWSEEDGISYDDLEGLLGEHKFQVPQALVEFYHALGGCEDLMEAHDFFWDPDELEIEDGYLLFLDEMDEEANWGFRAEHLAVPDPIVWIRTNTGKQRWQSEESTFSEFVFDMFDWVFNDDENDDELQD